MKKEIGILCIVTAIVLFVIGLFLVFIGNMAKRSSDDMRSNNRSSSAVTSSNVYEGKIDYTVVVDGCEYICFKWNIHGNQWYSNSVVHKGDCKNPKHFYAPSIK